MNRRLLLALAAAAVVTVPLAAAGEAMAQGRGNDREWRDNRGRGVDRWDDRRDNRGRGNGGWDNGRRGNDRWDDDRRWDNDRWDDNRRYNNNRWDDRRFNGYYLGNRWYYGPPPVAYYDRYDYRPGYQVWRRGQRLPNYYQSYVIYDYPRYRLRPPPRGYHWVRSNNDYILAAIATGLILEVISNGF